MAKNNAVAPAKGKAEKSDEDIELEGFMSEIEADLREDEIKKIWKRHGTLIVACAVAIVLGVLAVQLYRQYEVKQRTDIAVLYDQATQDLDANKYDAALAGYKAVEGRRFAGGFKVLAQLGQGAALLRKNDEAGAVKVYTAIAADQDVDPMYRDLATILRVLHSVDTADPKSLETLLAPLTNPGNAFHASANELTAVLAAKEGDKVRAYKLAEELLVDPATPTDMRQRVTDLATIYKPAETPKAEAAPATPAAEAPKAPAAAAPPAPAKPEAPKPATPSKP